MQRELNKLREDRMNRIKYTIVDKLSKETIPEQDLDKVISQRHKEFMRL